jgi:hypothetical protein
MQRFNLNLFCFLSTQFSATLMPEDRFLAAYARSWLAGLAALGKHTKSRAYKLFGMNSSGLNTFLPRYLTAQRPPKGFESRRACVHLASIVPFMQDTQVTESLSVCVCPSICPSVRLSVCLLVCTLCGFYASPALLVWFQIRLLIPHRCWLRLCPLSVCLSVWFLSRGVQEILSQSQ